MATQPFPPGWDVRKNQDVPCFGNQFGGFRNPVTGVTRKARNRQTTSSSGASLLTYISANLRESGTGSRARGEKILPFHKRLFQTFSI
jgi:hypothetical protein